MRLFILQFFSFFIIFNLFSTNALSQNDINHIQITHSGKDSSPILSSDKKMIAFIRTGNHIVPNGCNDFANLKSKYGDQIWIYEVETKKERLLVSNNFSCDKPEKQIVDPSHLQFSPDNKKLYFITSAWVTSGALHTVNIDGTEQHYLIPANAFEIISKGQYKGHLIVEQHRYFIGGGTYDWVWLFSPEGKEEGAVGPEVTKNQREFLESDAY